MNPVTVESINHVALIFVTGFIIALAVAFVALLCDSAWRWFREKKAKRREEEDAEAESRRLFFSPLLDTPKLCISAGGDPWNEKLTNENKLSVFSRVFDNPRLIRKMRCVIYSGEWYENIDPLPTVEATYGDKDKVRVIFKPIDVLKTGRVDEVHYIYEGILLKTHYINLSVNQGDKVKLNYSMSMGGDE